MAPHGESATDEKLAAPSVEVEEAKDLVHTSKQTHAEKDTNEEAETHPIVDSKRPDSVITSKRDSITEEVDAPTLPDKAPPLPDEAPPEGEDDDGWAPVWEASAQTYYFYNRFTGASQWTNPRIPETTIPPAPGTEARVDSSSIVLNPPPPTKEALPAGGYNPAIHGDYDPNAWYAQSGTAEEALLPNTQTADPGSQYAATAAFNRFTGRFQNAELTPENFNDENKSKRQMNAFFDVDAAANSHDGRSLKAERSGKKLTKTELKNFKEKRKAKKEEKRRAWLRD